MSGFETTDYFLVFFFQAEDGIRDRNVTGVQTCALPISCCSPNGPAVKKRAFVGPAAAPLPKARAHRPSIAIGGPSAAWSSPCCRSWPLPWKIGRASCRERVEVGGGAVAGEKKEEW